MQNTIEKEVIVKSPFDVLKGELKQILVAFVEKYPLSNEANIDAYIDALLRHNYPNIKRVAGGMGACYSFRRLRVYLRGVSNRTIKKILEAYEAEYLRIINEDHFQRTEDFRLEGEKQE